MKFSSLKLIIIIIIMAGLSQMFLINSFAIASAKIAKLERERTALTQTISELQNEISQRTALGNISAEAKTLGLSYSTDSFEFLSLPHVAVKANVTP